MPKRLSDATSIINISKRFWSKVNFTSDCWTWKASTNASGYGRFSLGGRAGKPEKAHRVAYYLSRGIWPSKYVLHRCDNPPCVRPDHLYNGTLSDNAKDVVQRGHNNGWLSSSRVGNNYPSSRLTEQDVSIIRSSSKTNKELGDLFNVSPENISSIRLRKTWKHI